MTDQNFVDIDYRINEIIRGISKHYDSEISKAQGIVFSKTSRQKEKERAERKIEKLEKERGKAIEVQNKLEAAQRIVRDSRKDFELLQHIQDLTKGIDSKLDKTVSNVKSEVSKEQQKAKDATVREIEKNPKVQSSFQSVRNGETSFNKSSDNLKPAYHTDEQNNLHRLAKNQRLKSYNDTNSHELREVEAEEKVIDAMLASKVGKVDEFVKAHQREKELIGKDKNLDDSQKKTRIKAVSKQQGAIRKKVAILRETYEQYYRNQNRIMRVDAAIKKYIIGQNSPDKISERLNQVKQTLAKTDLNLSTQINNLSAELGIDDKLNQVSNYQDEIQEQYREEIAANREMEQKRLEAEMAAPAHRQIQEAADTREFSKIRAEYFRKQAEQKHANYEPTYTDIGPEGQEVGSKGEAIEREIDRLQEEAKKAFEEARKELSAEGNVRIQGVQPEPTTVFGMRA